MRARGAVLRAYEEELDRLRVVDPVGVAVIEEYVAALRDESAGRRVRLRRLEAELRIGGWRG